MKDEPSPSWGLRGLKKWLAHSPETLDELMGLVQQSGKFLPPEMVDMVEGVLSLPSIQVREIMTPRPSIIGFNSDQLVKDIMPELLEAKHSRFPVFSNDDQDSVAGLLIVKDLLPLVFTGSADVPVSSIMRSVKFIPETARVDMLLKMLRHSKNHLAVVVDEYGHTSGIITLEDILEEIVGEIADEHDTEQDEKSYINLVDESAQIWQIDAQCPIADFNAMFDTDLEFEGVDTMGGLLVAHIGRVSDMKNEEVVLDHWRFKVADADERRILSILAEPQPLQTTAEV